MLFELSNGGILKISTSAFNRMQLYIQDKVEDDEAGGIILGRFIKDSKNIVIDKITVPMKGDERNRYQFKRAEKRHQRIVDLLWKKSKGTCNYLGEWHTHPEDIPSPSLKDKNEWKKKLKQGDFSSRYLYFIIVGIENIGVWEGDRRSLILKKLNYS
jgi:integrative and conjugative element protein (TIGR02256 family)